MFSLSKQIDHYVKNDMLKKLKNYIYNKKIKLDKNFALNCIQYGHYDIAVWIADVDSTLIFNQSAFRCACINGCKKIAQFIYNNCNSIDIHMDNNDIFRTTCLNKHYKVAEWLLNFNINSKDISIAFISACAFNSINIVKLLLNYDFDIRANNDDAFINACKKNNIDIVKLLAQKCNAYLYYADDNDIVWYKVKNIIDIIVENEHDNHEHDHHEHYNIINTNQQLNCIICYSSYDKIFKLCTRDNDHYYCYDCLNILGTEKCILCKENSIVSYYVNKQKI